MSYPDELKRDRTPGPWLADGCLVIGPHPKDAERKRIVAECPLDVGTWRQEAEGNARLIAAAPQLLEACEQALGVLWEEQARLDSPAPFDRTVEQLEAAIRAAREGE